MMKARDAASVQWIASLATEPVPVQWDGTAESMTGIGNKGISNDDHGRSPHEMGRTSIQAGNDSRGTDDGQSSQTRAAIQASGLDHPSPMTTMATPDEETEFAAMLMALPAGGVQTQSQYTTLMTTQLEGSREYVLHSTFLVLLQD